MRIYIGVGSNIHADSNIIKALPLMGKYFEIVAASTFYETVPEMALRQTNYINGVLAAETRFKPPKLRRILRKIERKVGRRRSSSADKYRSRQLDLDLILYGERVIKSRKLDIPDRQILSRPYLSRPLQELDPNLMLPDDGTAIGEIAARTDGSRMRALAGVTGEIRRYLSNE